MAQTENITRYICDRCAAEEYLEAGDRKREAWTEITRYATGRIEVRRLLCGTCAKAYAGLTAKQDAEFTTWMAGGE